jgi:holo-[acyl-carrier protein] synthase
MSAGAGGHAPAVAPRVGCDVVDVARLGRALERRPRMRARVFTPRELQSVRRGGAEAGSHVEIARLAARWAAKEATRKALGDLRLPFHAVEVVSGPDGAPSLHLHGRPSSLTCSLSHDGGVAMAVVLALGGEHHVDKEPTHAAG